MPLFRKILDFFSRKTDQDKLQDRMVSFHPSRRRRFDRVQPIGRRSMQNDLSDTESIQSLSSTRSIPVPLDLEGISSFIDGKLRDEPPSSTNTNFPIAKRYHTHAGEFDHIRSGNNDFYPEGICTQWYQPIFRGSLFTTTSSASPVGKRHFPVIHKNNTDDEAFAELKGGQYQSTNREWPTRLVNIHTGKTTHGDLDKAYIIGSYVCHPENLPPYPRLERRSNFSESSNMPSGDEWEYSTQFFDQVVAMIKRLEQAPTTNIPRFWILDDTTDMEKITQNFPQPDFSSCRMTAEHQVYIREVYYYLVAEAQLLGVDYVWLDCLCIDQRNPKDIASEIPRLHSYYRKARRCVVVSEMLRRGLSHSPDHLGFDVLDPTLDIELPSTCFSETYRLKYGLESEVVGWLVGFHQLRVWLFQETYLSREVVHRGRNIRLNTRDIMTRGLFPLRDESQGARGLERCRQSCLETLQRRLPLASAGIGETFHPNQCLALIRKQRRKSLYEADQIFGILGLFDEDVRVQIPTRYTVSLVGLSSMLMYARVRAGDLMALCIDEPAENHQRGELKDAPVWLPRTTINMAYPGGGMDIPDSGGSRSNELNLRCKVPGSGHLKLKAPRYRVRQVRHAVQSDIQESLLQQSESRYYDAGDSNKNTNDSEKIDWRDRFGRGYRKDLHPVEVEEGDLIIAIGVREHLTVQLYIKLRRTEGEKRAIEHLMQSANDWQQAAIVCIDTCKTAHFWLVLAANEPEGKTWRILGHLETALIHGGIGASGSDAPPRATFYIP